MSLKPATVEWMFESVEADLKSIIRQITTLNLEGADGPHAERLNAIHETLLTKVVPVFGEVRRGWEKRVMHHRQNAGELNI